MQSAASNELKRQAPIKASVLQFLYDDNAERQVCTNCTDT